MKKIIEKAKQILHDADSGSDECKHYNNGFLDGIKFAESELKNCNLQNVNVCFYKHLPTGLTGHFVKRYTPTGRNETIMINTPDNDMYFAPAHEFELIK